MPTIDYDHDPFDELDTGTPKEWTDEEVRKMFDDCDRIKNMEQATKIFIFMNKLLNQMEKNDAEDTGDMTSILREKILRGIGLSDAELENTVIAETCRLMFGKIAVKEFLRRMVTVARLVDLNEDVP